MGVVGGVLGVLGYWNANTALQANDKVELSVHAGSPRRIGITNRSRLPVVDVELRYLRLYRSNFRSTKRGS